MKKNNFFSCWVANMLPAHLKLRNKLKTASRFACLLTIALITGAISIQAQTLFGVAHWLLVGNTILIDKNNTIYLDNGNSYVVKYIAWPTATTIAGTGVSGHTGDLGPATSARIDASYKMALDEVHNCLYIAEQTYNYIRKVDLATGIITTIAGNGTNGNAGDGSVASGAGVEIGAPSSIAVDGAGNIFVGNVSCIRKIDYATNVISLYAGDETYAGFYDNGGTAIGARMDLCTDIKADALGNIYFCDQGNQRVRKVTTSGHISTVAGNGTAGTTGDGGAATSAEIWSPNCLSLDANGNIYISTFFRIRKVTIGGIISTYAGAGGNTATPLCVNPLTPNIEVTSIAMDNYGDLYMLDFLYNNINKISNGLEIRDVDFNTLCAPGSSAVNPQFTATVIGGAPPYTYTWTAIAGNSTTLSSTGVSNPTITASSGSNLAYYSLSVSDHSFCFPATVRTVKAQLTTASTFDLAMRDSYYDMLDEPNSQATVDPTKWDIWSSQDVWNRLHADGDLTHQPACSGACSNYMYATVRNVGCVASPSTATLKMYWTLDGYPETWPSMWTTALFGSTTLPQGLQIATLPIPSIPVGGRIQLDQLWTAPAPATYYPGTNVMGLCFLARILDGHNTSDPQGMTTPEGPGLSADVRGNNNIVTRNTMVINASNYAPQITMLKVGNSGPTRQTFSLQFLNTRPQASTLNQYMTITVNLGSVFNKWMQAGAYGTVSSMNQQNQSVTFDGTNTMELDSLGFDPGETDSIMITFAVTNAAGGYNMKDETVQFRQFSVDDQQNIDVYGNVSYYISYTGEGDATDSSSGQGQGNKLVSNVNNVAPNAYGIKVYPNPANTAIHFEFPIAKTGFIKLMDLTGRIITQQPLNNQTMASFDVQKYVPGIYMYELNNNGVTQRGKFVIAK